MGVQGRSLWPLLQGKEYPEQEFRSVMAQDGFGGMYYTKVDATEYREEGAVGKKGLFLMNLIHGHKVERCACSGRGIGNWFMI